MKKRKLGKTNIDVSIICLGTMTWGYQNTEEEAHEQLDYALSQGINFIDTAEIYAVPPSPETYGKTETYIGNYFKKNPNVREKIVLATKIAGPRVPYIRDGVGFSPSSIKEAIEGSLKRLQTDYIDLYQLHWPQRMVPIFGNLDFHSSWFQQEDNFLETLGELAKLQKQGLIREVGLSNETSWGLMKCLHLHEQDPQLPRIQSVQNVYSLVSRVADSSLTEVLGRENVSLLPYSPLAGGLLTGKYQNGARPEGSRFTTWGSDRMTRYLNSRAETAINDYVALAKDHGLSPAQMALAFVNNRSFVASNIIGATSMEQLKECIATHDMELSQEVIDNIEKIHKVNANPAV